MATDLANRDEAIASKGSPLRVIQSLELIDLDRCFNSVDLPQPLGPIIAVILFSGN